MELLGAKVKDFMKSCAENGIYNKSHSYPIFNFIFEMPQEV